MSFNVKDIYPTVSTLTFDPTTTSIATSGKQTGLQGPVEGEVWYDSIQHNLYAFINGEIVSLQTTTNNPAFTGSTINTPVTATNPNSAAANLMSYVFPAGALNQLNRNIDFYASGYYTTAAAQTPTITLLGSLSDGTNTRTLFTWTTAATTAASTNYVWNFDGTLFTTAVGTSGTVLSHGTLNIAQGASSAAAIASYNDTNHASSSSLNLTLAITFQITVQTSTSNAGNSVSEDSLWIAVS